MNIRKSLLAAAFALVALPGIAVSAWAGSDVPPGPPVARPAGTLPAGQTMRYVIPFFTSQTAFPTGRSVTVVTINNNSSASCTATLRFQFASQTADTCTITATIASHLSKIFCSRSVSDPISPCSVSCSPGLTFNTGKVYISSTTTPTACNLLAVDPRIYYTNGNDTVLLSSSQLSIVKFGAATAGD